MPQISPPLTSFPRFLRFFLAHAKQKASVPSELPSMAASQARASSSSQLRGAQTERQRPASRTVESVKHTKAVSLSTYNQKKTTKVWLKTGLYTSYVCVDTSSGKWWNDGNVSLPDDCFLWKHGLDGSHPVVGWEPQNNGGGNTPVGKQMLFSSLSR